jgi:hypothetical protein
MSLIGPTRYSKNTGPNTMNSTPSPDTNTFGRDLFRIHGDKANHDASTGCTVASPDVRREINTGTDRTLNDGWDRTLCVVP